MAPQTEIYKCPDCDKNVTKSQRSIACAYCNNYFHIQCAHISMEQYNLMLKNKVFKYICDNCLMTPKICNVQEELKKGFAALTASLEKELEMKVQESQRILNEKIECAIKLIEEKFNTFASSHPQNTNNVELVKTDVKNCFDVIKAVDNAANKRLTWLETQKSIMQRRLNRADIIIRGLPRKIKNLRTPILKICSLCNVTVTDSDIQHCTYFAGGKAVLVKFNSVQTRDAVMINYNKSRTIKLDDVVQPSLSNGVQSDIILNDHLTEDARKLISVCRKLRNDGKIVKYKFRNYDVPKVRVIYLDGSSDLLSYDQCINLLGDFNDSSFSTINNYNNGDSFI